MQAKRIDWTQAGGFPLTQDELEYDRDGISDALDAHMHTGGDGTTPYVLKGMVVSGGGNTVSSGMFFYNGEAIAFTGGTVAPAGADVALVLITVSATPLTFNDASTPAVVLNKTATLVAGATVTDATHFPVSALLPFGVSFGRQHRESAWSSIAVATVAGSGGVTGTIYYKKDLVANTLQIRGQLISANPNNFTATPAQASYVMGTLPVGYCPGNACYIKGITGDNPPTATRFKNDLGDSYIDEVDIGIATGGTINVAWIKPDAAITGYFVLFNSIIPLD